MREKMLPVTVLRFTFTVAETVTVPPKIKNWLFDTVTVHVLMKYVVLITYKG